MGACVLGGVSDGLNAGLKPGAGALAGRGLLGAFCIGVLAGCFTGCFVIFFGAAGCFLGCSTFFGADEGEETAFFTAFEGAEGRDTFLLGSCLPPALEFLSERYFVFLFIGVASFCVITNSISLGFKGGF